MSKTSGKIPLSELAKVIFYGPASKRFFWATLASLAFSIAVILSTIGLMDGFKTSLTNNLRQASGDLIITNRNGFFNQYASLETLKNLEYVDIATPLIQTEGFLLQEGSSLGIVLRGIEEESFEKVTGLELDLDNAGVVVGEALVQELQLHPQEKKEVVLTFAKENTSIDSLPLLKRFPISGEVRHGIYEKDLRFIYIPMPKLKDILDVKGRINMALVKIKDEALKQNELSYWQEEIQEELGFSFQVKTYWDEFSSLLEAVQIEKLSITVILQLIVVIAIFNIAAFIIYISERKARDLFLFQALGLERKRMLKFWMFFVCFLWFGACVLSIGLTEIFEYLLRTWSLFRLPGKIYVLGELKLDLHTFDYFIVFSLSLLWILLVTWLGFYRSSKTSLISGLRREFQ